MRETLLTVGFRARAISRHITCPEMDDYFGWLSLMRHHQLPTRLLDWSESLGVAAFFAVEETDVTEDAVIWAFGPTKLSLSAPMTDVDDDAQLLAQYAFRRQEGPKVDPAPVVARENNARMLVQRAAFTIHVSAEPLDNHVQQESFLLPGRIPNAAIPGIRSALLALGINRSALFPDLDHLAKHLTF